MGKPGKGLGLAIADYDHDGWMDILLANDSIPEFLFHNKGNGTFEEVGLVSGIGLDGSGGTFAGMGVDFEDYNNDGWPDVIITDLANQKYALYTNARDGTFEYSTLSAAWEQLVCCIRHGACVSLITTMTAGRIYSWFSRTSWIRSRSNEPHLRYRESPLLLWNDKGKKFVDVSAQSGEGLSAKVGCARHGDRRH